MSLVELPFGLPGAIYRSAMPLGSFDPGGGLIAAYRAAGIATIVMLLPDEECLRRDNVDLRARYAREGFAVLYFPIVNYSVPYSIEATRELIGEIVDRAGRGERIAVHCYGGWGRTGIVLALLARAVCGYSGDQAIEWVRRSVPGAVETDEQESFVREFTFTE
ncbi:MAG TPA: hypothetical protein PKM65_15850 [Spirochaetota bacterium]|nr:hypothetical protein [Spirochaetota bacterium]HNT11873.1 hypothetical protein [Spirochaetota bacterium]HPI23077.1 hypothetical protein [Spirochaetota bacterium]